MSVTSVEKDFENLTMTLTAEFDVPVDRVWQLWADPRQLEQWWGPPSHPATVEEHDLTPGGQITYFMTTPEGEKLPGWWRVVAADPPTTLEVVEGLGTSPDHAPDMPATIMRVEIAPAGSGARMTLRSSFDSREDMDKLMSIGMAEGQQESVGQMDALLR